jgi:hypothetical protein
MRPSGGLEVADIFRQHGPAYRESHRLPRNGLRVMRAIEVCRTAALGGHRDQCDHCGYVEISYNSCRNRHCPKCQTLQKEKWIEARSQDLLPIEYFHVVFTLPSELNHLALLNQRVLYDLLFRSASETLTKLAQDQKHLGATVGVIGILHTWGQNLMDHPHLHCIVTDRLSHLKDPADFETFRKNLYHKKWVVYCRPPFDGIQGVLQYLGRYTHRIAISNHRILSNQGGNVSFLWRDYAESQRQKTMTLKANEFIRRFLLHVLPARYVRIRHFGLLANRKRKDNIAACRKMIDRGKPVTKENARIETWQEQLLRICGIDVTTCPVCQKGRMCRIARLLPYRCNSP